MTHTDLKPCPFCGGEALKCNRVMLPKAHWVLCKNCGACPGDRDTEAAAITAWNTRTPDTAPSQSADLIAEAEAYFTSPAVATSEARRHVATLITALRAAEAREKALRENEIPWNIPPEIAEVVLKVGRAEWGATDAMDGEGHAECMAKSVKLTEQHFGLNGPQPMHGLYVEGTGTVVCHTGMSPNSANIARALTGAWNLLHEEIARRALGGSPDA